MMKHILLVEDNEDIQLSLRDALEEDGAYSVATAGNGAEALALLERGERPNMMLVDLLMPVMDGVELIDRMRRDARFAGIPVVVLSAASITSPPPGTPLLRKPIRYEALLGAVQKACGC